MAKQNKTEKTAPLKTPLGVREVSNKQKILELQVELQRLSMEKEQLINNINHKMGLIVQKITNLR
jgi:hypothetical protein